MPLKTHLHWVKSACKHYYKAKTKHDIHSPFLSQWVEEIYEDDRWFEAFGIIIGIRHFWKQSPDKVKYIDDPGAGSRAGQGLERSVKEMVKYSAIDEYSGRLLFRIANFHQPETILELGTNLGFSAMYFRAARRYAKIISIEGQPEVAELAKKSFDIARLPIIDIRTGTFQDQLPKAIADLNKIDLFWLDGDHRCGPTIDYINQVLPHLEENSIVIVGDIHWSAGMEKAWEQLKKMPEVTLSLDLFHFGILFFIKEEGHVEHFSIIPYWMKPWRLGFFSYVDRSGE